MNSLSTPVLLLVFNRLDVTKLVFNSIKIAKPTKLYIACDGPRKHKINEDKIVSELRQYLLDNIDWKCEVTTLFREENLGCGLAVSQAITWFFEHEEMGIILEDDCLPSQSFFKFCSQILVTYEKDRRIWHVSGYSLLKGSDLIEDSYYFSRITQIWGWATWRDRWQHFDLQMTNYNEFKQSSYLKGLFPRLGLRLWHKHLFEANYKRHDTWDCQWYFTALINNGIAVTPKISLVENLGFNDISSAHPEFDSTINKIKASDIEFPLKAPDYICLNSKLDNIYFSWRTKRGVFIKIVLKPIYQIDQKYFGNKILNTYKSLRRKFGL